MLIKSKEKLNSYISRKNQIFYVSLPLSGDSKLNLSTVGTTFPNSNFLSETNIFSASAKFYLFEYIVGGKGYLKWNNTTYELEKGTLIFIAKNQPFTIYSDKKDPLHKHFMSANGEFIDSILSLYSISVPMIVAKVDALEEFENVISYLRETDQLSRNLLNRIEVELLKLVQKIENVIIERNLMHASRAENILSYIEQNLTTDISIEDITSAFFISKSQMMRIFKKEYKVTPMQYILKRKTDMAAYYLKRTEKSISEISELLGFSNSNYFSKAFKKQTSMSPMEYRKKEYYEIEQINNVKRRALEKSQTDKMQ